MSIEGRTLDQIPGPSRVCYLCTQAGSYDPPVAAAEPDSPMPDHGRHRNRESVWPARIVRITLIGRARVRRTNGPIRYTPRVPVGHRVFSRCPRVAEGTITGKRCMWHIRDYRCVRERSIPHGTIVQAASGPHNPGVESVIGDSAGVKSADCVEYAKRRRRAGRAW